MQDQIFDDAELREIEEAMARGEQPPASVPAETPAPESAPSQSGPAEAEPAVQYPPKLGTDARPWPAQTAPRVTGHNMGKLLLQLRRLARGADPYAGDDRREV